MTPPPDPNPTAPVEEKCATCGREEVWHRGSMHGFRKPAPAPEPKQGSEEPMMGMRAAEWDIERLQKANAALRVEVETLRREHGWNECERLEAELAQAREEIARLKERIASMDEDITAFGEADMALTAICNRERAAREKAEARVKELEVLIVNGGIKEMTEEARAILARAKEGDKR